MAFKRFLFCVVYYYHLSLCCNKNPQQTLWIKTKVSVIFNVMPRGWQSKTSSSCAHVRVLSIWACIWQSIIWTASKTYTFLKHFCQYSNREYALNPLLICFLMWASTHKSYTISTQSSNIKEYLNLSDQLSILWAQIKSWEKYWRLVNIFLQH